ncbi:DUF4386 family protein [Abyssisolibacter fermentans]|uniref:DUF4386 family protein n=1 Tax=Abyssisolibacter fermentans TaxID=1766203 RepID=UPI000836E660|nr:DUF4386 family protein [Abyssisolibacter fermentans]
MNKKLGFYSAVLVGITTLIFAVSMLIGNLSLAYFVCMILSWGYILLTCAFYTETIDDRKSVALGGVAFGCLYGVLINVVYFTQLTTVANKTASENVIQVLSYQSLGSLFFSFDLFGYGMMALSTFLVGVSMIAKNKNDKWLKVLLIVHGTFLISCVGMPILNIFKDSSDSSSFAGTIALLIWCIYFIPVAILSAVHFRKEMNLR